MHLLCCASTMVPCFTTLSSFIILKLGVGHLLPLVCALNTQPTFNTFNGIFMFNTMQLFIVPLQSPLIAQGPAQVTVRPSPEYQAAAVQQQRINPAELCGGFSSFFNLVPFLFSQTLCLFGLPCQNL